MPGQRIIVSWFKRITDVAPASLLLPQAQRFQSLSSGLSMVLGMGDTRASFQLLGNELLAIQWLIICASGEVIHSAASLTYLTGIWSRPVEQSDRRLFSSFRTSWKVTGRKLNDWLALSGKVLIRFRRSLGNEGGDPSKCWLLMDNSWGKHKEK